MSGTSSSDLTATRRFIATRGTATCCPVPGPKGDPGETGPQGPATTAKVVNTDDGTVMTTTDYVDISGTVTTLSILPGSTNAITVIGNVSFRGAEIGDEIHIKLFIDGAAYFPFIGYAMDGGSTHKGVGTITVMGIQNCSTVGNPVIKMQVKNVTAKRGTVYQASMHLLGNVISQL